MWGWPSVATRRYVNILLIHEGVATNGWPRRATPTVATNARALQ